MKKILILALILLLGCAPAMAGCGSSQDTPPSKEAKKYPEISFENDTYKYDFGKIERGKAVSHTFKFRNTGRVPLVILDVAVSCGCTTSQYTKEPVLPGRYGEGFGRFTKSATLTLNTRKGREVLYITGEIKN